MKKMMIALVAMLTIAATGKAMSYEQARNEALFLTDKMAYELNLTEEQYEAAYEINLDYLMGVTSYDDVYGTYWERRNLDLSYILLDWQLNAFRAATYFYRPLYWSDGFWHFGIYARYPHRDYFFFGRPVFYASYRGGHAWHVNGGRSWYHGRRDHYIHHHNTNHFGMRDGWNRGDFRNHQNGVRNSSTRTTVNHRDNTNRNWNRGTRPSGVKGNTTNNTGTRSLGGYRSNSPSRNIGGNSSRSIGGNSSRSTSSSSHSSAPTMRSGGSSHSGGSFSRSSAGRSSGGSGHSTGGGHSYGGHR